MALWQWSKTAPNNATADPTMNWAEGMAPSLVNDDARAMMARLAEYRDDISGMQPTAGTGGAYTLATNQGNLPATPPDGQLVGFRPHTNNLANATLAVDGGSAFPLNTAVGMPANTLIGGLPYTAMFSVSASSWLLLNFFGQFLGSVPLGAMLDYCGTVSPSGNFALPHGQALSTTTYAALYALFGANRFGPDSGGNFLLPDLRGRVCATLDNLGGTAFGRIPNGVPIPSDGSDNPGGTLNGSQLGSAGGSFAHGQTPAEMATYTPAGTISGTVTPSSFVPQTQTPTNLLAAGPGAYVPFNAPGGGSSNAQVPPNISFPFSGSFAGTTQTQTRSMIWLQPTMMVGKIIRIL